MRRKLRALRHLLRSGDAWTAGRAWLGLLWVDLALRSRPFPQLQAWARHPSKPSGKQDLRRGRRLAELVSTAARHHLYPMTCLRRSLVLQRMLREEGFAADLCIGVRKDKGNLQAHAWVEVDGQPVGEREQVTEEYQAMVLQGRTG